MSEQSSESDNEPAIDSPIASPIPVVQQLTKKQELNNHIVLMRKKVRQAKVHVIRKLTREAKQLQNRKGPEKVQAKAKRKAERLIQDILVVKKLNEDRVSAYALQCNTSLLDTLRNLKTTTEARALARLAHHSAVQADVISYRTQNPHWELQIPVLLEKSKEKVKKLKKKQEERENKNTNIDANSPEDETAVNEADDTPLTTEAISEANPKKRITKPPIKPAKSDNKTKQKLIGNLKPVKIDKSEGTVRIQVLKNLVDLEKTDTAIVDIDKEESELVAKKKPKSSFFVGGVDRPSPEKEVKQSVKNENESYKQNNRSNFQQQPVFRKGKLISSAHKTNFTNNHREGTNFKRNQSSRYFDQPITQNRETKSFDYSAKTHTIVKGPNNAPVTTSEKLHPSWEAKKRQAPAIASFQGKKITFGDD